MEPLIRFMVPNEAMPAGAGARDPDRQSRWPAAWRDGVLFDSVAGAGAADEEQPRVGAAELLPGMLAD